MPRKSSRKAIFLVSLDDPFGFCLFILTHAESPEMAKKNAFLTLQRTTLNPKFYIVRDAVPYKGKIDHHLKFDRLYMEHMTKWFMQPERSDDHAQI